MTHFYCAMSTVAKRGYSRYAGAVEAGYLQDFDIEVIADGVHLPDDLLRMVYRLKGPDRVVLCTDSIRATGLPDGEYIQGSLENGLKFIVENGVALRPDRGGLAGSVATTDRLVRTMARAIAGAAGTASGTASGLASGPASAPASSLAAGIPDAVRMMTATPARVLGLPAKGRLAPGCDADIILFDDTVAVSRVFIGGKEIPQEARHGSTPPRWAPLASRCSYRSIDGTYTSKHHQNARTGPSAGPIRTPDISPAGRKCG
jgi:N-acetylglucosamine-6-phosphate deacetylase